MISDQAVVAWIDRYLEEHRYAPSVRDVSKYLGVNLATTHSRLTLLRRKGKVIWNDGETRTLRTVKNGQTESTRRRRAA